MANAAPGCRLSNRRIGQIKRQVAQPLADQQCLTRVSGRVSAAGASSVKPPRWPQRKKSSAQSLPKRRASRARTSVNTGQVVKRWVFGLLCNHCSTGTCQWSARLNKASSGLLSATTCRKAGGALVSDLTLSLATVRGSGSCGLQCAFFVPHLRKLGLTLAGQVIGASIESK